MAGISTAEVVLGVTVVGLGGLVVYQQSQIGDLRQRLAAATQQNPFQQGLALLQGALGGGSGSGQGAGNWLAQGQSAIADLEHTLGMDPSTGAQGAGAGAGSGSGAGTGGGWFW